jgi:hypothetical protein
VKGEKGKREEGRGMWEVGRAAAVFSIQQPAVSEERRVKRRSGR